MRACFRRHRLLNDLRKYYGSPCRSSNHLIRTLRGLAAQGELPHHVYPAISEVRQARHASSFSQHDEPTIYALSTAPGRAAIAIVRISGPACLTIYHALCPSRPLPRPRHATLRTLYEPGESDAKATALDSDALILYFPAPETATGEDVLELHVHGGTAVVKAVLSSVSKALPKGSPHSIRYAEPGEFTRRAFYNNRLDLLQIEALGDTLFADTEQQRRLAVRGSISVLAERYQSWNRELVDARGELEALIDFSEDQHFDESPAQLCAAVSDKIQRLKMHLQGIIKGASRGELLRDGISIALIGSPNAGKSSLLNQIVGREAAIVSSEAGTTRDVVDVHVDIGGYYCKFGDLAGLRKASTSHGIPQIGEVEKEGIRRARQRALASDVIIAVIPAIIVDEPSGPRATVKVDSEVLEVLDQCDLQKQKIVFVLNKADLFGNNAQLSDSFEELRRHAIFASYLNSSETIMSAISCINAQVKAAVNTDPGGIQALLDSLIRLFGQMTSSPISDDPEAIANSSLWAESLGATERQRVLLHQCLQYLENFLLETRFSSAENAEDVDIVLAAESLRSAAECLSKILGKGEAGDVEEVLGVVFAKYVSNTFRS